MRGRTGRVVRTPVGRELETPSQVRLGALTMAAVRLSPAVPKPSDPDQAGGTAARRAGRTTRNGLSPGLSARLDDRVTRGVVAGPCGNSEAALGPVPRPIRRSYPGSAYLMDVQSLQLTSWPPSRAPEAPTPSGCGRPAARLRRRGPAAGAVASTRELLLGYTGVSIVLGLGALVWTTLTIPLLPAIDPGLEGTSLAGPEGGLLLWIALRARRLASGPPDPRQLGGLDVPLPVRRRGDGPRRPDRGRMGGVPRDPRATRARVPALVRHARQPLGHGLRRGRRRPDGPRRPRGPLELSTWTRGRQA